MSDTRYDRGWLARLVGIVTTARVAGGLVAALLMLGAALTAAAVVKLSLHARRDELEIMQLVGAPFSYVRSPASVEGLLLGGLGAGIVAWLPSPCCLSRWPRAWVLTSPG